MITTISLINIHYLIQILFVLVMRISRSTVNNFQIYRKAMLTIVIMSYITSLVLIYLITISLYLLTTFIQLPNSSINIVELMNRHILVLSMKKENELFSIQKLPATYHELNESRDHTCLVILLSLQCFSQCPAQQIFLKGRPVTFPILPAP